MAILLKKAQDWLDKVASRFLSKGPASVVCRCGLMSIRVSQPRFSSFS
jgi:hypothetical protein